MKLRFTAACVAAAFLTAGCFQRSAPAPPQPTTPAIRPLPPPLPTVSSRTVITRSVEIVTNLDTGKLFTNVWTRISHKPTVQLEGLMRAAVVRPPPPPPTTNFTFTWEHGETYPPSGVISNSFTNVFTDALQARSMTGGVWMTITSGIPWSQMQTVKMVSLDPNRQFRVRTTIP